MPRYRIEIPIHKVEVYEIEAENEEDALENVYEKGEMIESHDLCNDGNNSIYDDEPEIMELEQCPQCKQFKVFDKGKICNDCRFKSLNNPK